MEIRIQEATIEQDLYVLPMEGANLVLGVQWLETLGPVVTNYKELTLQFEKQGSKVTFQGIPHLAESEISGGGLRRLIARREVAYFCHLRCEPPGYQGKIHSGIETVLEQFAAIFGEPDGLPPNRPTDHHIELEPGAKPININSYRYPYFQKNEIERLTAEMIQQGLVRPSTSLFSSPVLLVRKKDGSLRFCVDHRALNAVTVRDRFPIPTMDKLIDELHGTKLFLKLDLRAGYHQIRIVEEDKISIPYSPRSLRVYRNAVWTQKRSGDISGYYESIVIGILEKICGRLLRRHPHLRSVGRRTPPALTKGIGIIGGSIIFSAENQVLFWSTGTGFLGHIITTDGVKPDPDKLAAVESWPLPQTVRQLRSYLGFTGYYRRFIRQYAQIAAPMTNLLKKQQFKWTEEATEAFNNLKHILTTAPVLIYPDFQKPFMIETDACDVGVGAILLQLEHPVAFYSKKLSSLRQRASTYSKELWAITDAVQKWRHYLLGSTFTIRTDHHSLKNLLNQVIQTLEQQYFLSKLLGYSYTIIYKSGRENVAADALSRLPVIGEEVSSNQLLAPSCQPLPDWLEILRKEN